MTYKILRGYLSYVLAPYLNFKDFINFCRLFRPRKNLKVLFDKCMANAVDIYLKKLFGQHYDKWKQMMAMNHVILSGSTILQILLQEEWENSDLDFFNPVAEVKTMGLTGFFSKFEDFVYSTLQSHDERDPLPRYAFDADKKIIRVDSYKVNDKKIQIISIKENSDYNALVWFVCKSFDIYVLMNIFYYELDSTTGEIVPHLRLFDLNSIMTKTSEKWKTRTNKTHRQRVVKYQKRGFTFK